MFHQSNHPHKAYLKTILRYKKPDTANAIPPGFVRENDNSAWDYSDAIARRPTYGGSNELEFIGLFGFHLFYL